MDDEELIDKIEDTLEFLDYLEQRKAETINKIFSSLKGQSSLLEILRSYQRTELDEVKRILGLRGLSGLNKEKLSSAMVEMIKSQLPIILSRLTGKEFKIIRKLVKSKGCLLYTTDIRDELLYLRKLGFIGCFTDESGSRYIFLPVDIFESIDEICSSLEVVGCIKLNERVNKLLKGLLYHYGVIAYSRLQEYIKPFFRELPSSLRIMQIVLENSYKEYGLCYDGTYLYHEEVFDPEEVESQQNIRDKLDFLPLSEAQVLSASEDNYRDWNLYDQKLYNFIDSNFDIDIEDAEEFVNELKMDFRSGFAFSEAIEELSRSFELEDIELLRTISGLVKDVYNHSGQWVLKGNSPSEARNLTKPSQSLQEELAAETLSFKVGRNDLCPCGSGKKFKNCCLKKHF
ncbi:MAG: SEC-C domain-containing protein [Bacillota bacterium]|nr:SEC-C domain-containing protein [Bacillota bacterium]